MYTTPERTTYYYIYSYRWNNCRFIVDNNLMLIIKIKISWFKHKLFIYRSAGIIWVVANFVGHSVHVGRGAVCQNAINTLNAASWFCTNGQQSFFNLRFFFKILKLQSKNHWFKYVNVNYSLLYIYLVFVAQIRKTLAASHRYTNIFYFICKFFPCKKR